MQYVYELSPFHSEHKWMTTNTVEEIEIFIDIHYTTPMPSRHFDEVKTMVEEDHETFVTAHPELSDYVSVEMGGEYTITIQ